MIARGVRLAALALLLGAAGCATTPAELPPSAATPPPAPATTPAPAAPVRATAGSAAAPDTVPSRAALAVLASIPEPLPQGVPARGVPTPPAPRAHATPPAPTPAPAHADAVAPRTTGDSTITAADTAVVPVPTPTRPLANPAATLPAPAPPPVVTPAPAGAPPGQTAAAAPDTCWRVQVGAPTERARGHMLRDAAQSLLVVPMVEVREGGRFKIRTRDCLGRTAAESLRDRAMASGFKGVFLVRFVEPK